MKAIISELNRRNVIRVALLYGALSWLLIQIAETVLPVFEIPTWVLRLIILLLALGFLPAIIFAWVYELTPDGIKKEKEIDRDESITRTTGRKLDIAVLLLLAATIGLFLLNPMGGRLEEPHNLAKGVAVLPFDNLSDNTENAFFAAGIHEDILTHLSAIRDFRVISRTSVEAYADTDLRMPQIAEELGVTHIVEGSVRRAGDKVRVTVQLIDGQNDEHVWAENYDRTLSDIFEIQSEVARKIVTNIKDELSPQELASIDRKPTKSTRAYELYKEALASTQPSVRSSVVMEEPIRLMQKAVQEDPDYLDAWLKLVEFCGDAVWWNAHEYVSCARDARDTIATLAPDSAQLLFADGLNLYRIERDYQGALNKLQSAVAALPNEKALWQSLGYSARRALQWSTASNALYQWTLLDPKDEKAFEDYIDTLWLSGDWQYAIKTAKEATQRFPESALMRMMLAELNRKYVGDLSDYPAAMQALPPNLRWNFGEVFVDAAFVSDEERIAWMESTTEVALLAKSRVQYVRGMLLLIKGQSEAGNGLLESAHETYMALVGENWRQRNASTFAIVAVGAANSAKYELAQEALDLFSQTVERQNNILLQNEWGKWAAVAYAAMGKEGLAWNEVERLLDAGTTVTPWDLKQNLVLQYYFSDHPEYQRLTRNLVPGSLPSR